MVHLQFSRCLDLSISICPVPIAMPPGLAILGMLVTRTMTPMTRARKCHEQPKAIADAIATFAKAHTRIDGNQDGRREAPALGPHIPVSLSLPARRHHGALPLRRANQSLVQAPKTYSLEKVDTRPGALVDTQREHIRPRIVANHIEVVASTHQLVEVDFRGQ